MAHNKIRAVAIGGALEAGKDTAAEVLVQLGWKKDGFAVPLKKIALAVNPLIPLIAKDGTKRDVVENPSCEDYPIIRLQTLVDDIGWRAAKDYVEVRRFLQKLGSEGVRDNLGEDTWVESFKQRWVDRTVICDCRFPNEIEFCKRNGIYTIYIARDSKKPSGTHASEQDLSHLYDAVIDNNGTVEDLHRKMVVALGAVGVALN